MPSPYTLAGLLDEAAARRPRRAQQPASSASPASAGRVLPPLDCLGAVLSVVPAPAGRAAKRRRLRQRRGVAATAMADAEVVVAGGGGGGVPLVLLLAGPSLPPATCVRLRLPAAEAAALGGAGAVRRGDVVRVHRAEVTSDARGGGAEVVVVGAGGGGGGIGGEGGGVRRDAASSSTTASSSRLPAVVADLRPSRSDPEAGPALARVGTAAGGGCLGMAGAGAGADEDEDKPGGGEGRRVLELLRWFRDLHGGGQGGRQGEVPAPASASAFPASGPSQRRRLRDVVRPGLLSDVEVRVAAFDDGGGGAGSSSGGGGTWGGRRRRWCVATLTDGPGPDDLLPLRGGCRRLREELRGAAAGGAGVGGGRRLLLTRLLSLQEGDGGGGGPASSLRLFLVATAGTAAVVLPEVPGPGPDPAGGGGGEGTWDEGGYVRTQDLGRECFGTEEEEEEEQEEAAGGADRRVVLASMRDVRPDAVGASLAAEEAGGGRGLLSDPGLLGAALVVPSDPPRYRGATAELVLLADDGPSLLAIRVPPAVMEVLCCSCPAADLLAGAGAGAGVGGEDGHSARAALRRANVLEIFRGYLHLAVPLRWTLRRGMGGDPAAQWTAVDVLLPEW